MNQKKWIIGAVAGLVLLLACVGGYQVYRQMQVSEAQKLFDDGNYAGVISYFAPVLEGSSALAEERILLARSLYRLQRYEEAQTIIAPLLEFGEENADAVKLAGWLAIAQNLALSAEERFEKLAVMGRNGEANAGRVAALLVRSEGYRQDELSQARFLLSELLTENADSVFVQLTAAELNLIEHDYERATEHAQRAVDLAPHWSRPHVMLGRAYLMSGMVSEAEASLQQALERGGSEDESRYFLARSVYLQGRLGESRTLLDGIIGTESSFVRVALEDAARIDIAMGNLEQAVERLRQALAIRETPITGLQLYHVLVRLGEEIEAGQLLDTILASRPFVSEARLERAHRYLREDEERRAVNEYRSVRDSDPQNALAAFNLGSLALGSDIAHTAPSLLELSRDAYPDFLPATVNHALSLVDTGQVADAGAMLLPMIEASPDIVSLRVAYALQQFAAGETESALYWLVDVDEENPSSEMALLRGELFLRLYLNERARDEFALAMDLDPDSRRARLDYAHALVRLNLYEEAEAVYEAMMEGRTLPVSLSMQVRNALALIEYDQGNVQQARELWDELKSESDSARRLAQLNELFVQSADWRAADINRLSELTLENDALPETQYNLALAYERNGQISDAIVAYESLLVTYPRFLPALLNLSELLLAEQRYDEAIPVAQRARRVAPERDDIQTNMAAVLVEAERLDEAKEELDAVLSRSPNDAQVVLNQAILSVWRGDREAATRFANQLAELEGEDERVWVIRGLLFMQENELRQAEQAFRQARSINPDDEWAALNHGVVLSMLDRPEFAMQALEEAVAINSELAPAHRALGLMLAERGRYREAIRLLNLSLNHDPQQDDLRETIQRIQGWLAQEAE